jgi:hypothetical protein
MRIDSAGRPWILEVNANPDIAPDAGLARMAGIAGIEYPALIRGLCELGLDRTREKISVEEGWALAQRLSGITAEELHPAPALDLFTAGLEDTAARAGRARYSRAARSGEPSQQAVGDH